jgi:hypothetical protein
VLGGSKWMNKEAINQKKFVISHSTYDDELPKKCWVDEKWMNREAIKHIKKKVCDLTFHV